MFIERPESTSSLLSGKSALCIYIEFQLMPSFPSFSLPHPPLQTPSSESPLGFAWQLSSFHIIVLLCIYTELFRTMESEVSQSCLTLRSYGLQSTRLLCSWDFPGKSTGVSCHFLLQGIFLTQGSNPGLLHCRQTLFSLSHQEAIAPTNLQWSLTSSTR